MPPISRLAVLTQLGLITYVGLAAAWIVQIWRRSLTQALLSLAVFLILPAAIIALGVILTYLTSHRQNSKSTWHMAYRTWWTELLAAAQAILWWQPFRWRQFPNTMLQTRKASTKNAPVVILLHGLVSNRGLWNPWTRRLEKQSVNIVSVNLEPLFGSIDRYVQLVEDAVSQAEQISDIKPIVVCHSMGGLAVRKWLVSHTEARDRIGQIVTIGTPHFGTWLGKLSLATNGREMRLGSDWLADLEAQEKKLRPDDTYSGFVCWYSTTDNIVIPASSARLPGADNRKIAGVGHLALAYHPRVMELEHYLSGLDSTSADQSTLLASKT